MLKAHSRVSSEGNWASVSVGDAEVALGSGCDLAGCDAPGKLLSL